MSEMLKNTAPGASCEDVALKLLYLVAWGENIDLEGWAKADRDWILGTYAECLRAVKDPQSRPPVAKPASVAVQQKG
ncbi:MAG: hypothetical protein JO256_03655 [Alphaproteobacteria bacterium]|nr:hypothetical protein [Alphaproteobacteria bacterium]